MKPKKQVPDPAAILAEVTEFAELAKSGAYMAGDRRVHHTERSKWRFTFKRLVTDALAALAASEPGPAQEAIGKIVDLTIEMKSRDYFHSDDPVEAAKFVVSDAVAALWDSILRHDGVAAFTQRVPPSSSAGNRSTAGPAAATVRSRRRRRLSPRCSPGC